MASRVAHAQQSHSGKRKRASINNTKVAISLLQAIELKILFTNVDTLTKEKVIELRHKISGEQLPPQVIAPQEVKPKNFNEKNRMEYYIEGYEMLTKNLATKCGRGLLLYIQKGIHYEEVVFDAKATEYIAAKIIGKNKYVLLVSIYRSPNSDKKNNEKIIALLEEIIEYKSEHKIIMGDFNLPNIEWENLTCKSGNILSTYIIEKMQNYFVQHIYEITRFRRNTRGSILDLVFTDNNTSVKNINVTAPLGKSDHGCVDFTCNIELPQKKRNILEYPYGCSDFEQLNEPLRAVNWNEYVNSNDINEIIAKFNKTLQDAIDECIPERKFKSMNGLIIPKIIKKINEKTELWIKLRKSMEDVDNNIRREYDQITDEIIQGSREVIKNVQKPIIKNVKLNLNIFWKYIEFKTKIIKTNNDNDKAMILDQFFCSIFTEETEGNTKRDIKDIPELLQIEFTHEDICRNIDKLPSDESPGPERLYYYVIKEVKNAIAHPLKLIFNQVLRNNNLPTDWTEENITVLTINGDKSDLENYMQIILTRVICELMNSLIRERFERFIKHR